MLAKKKYLIFNILIFVMSWQLTVCFVNYQKKNTVLITDTNSLAIYKTAWKALNDKFYLNSSTDIKSWENKFVHKIQDSEDAHKYIKALTNELHDPYTRFLSKEELEEEREFINSKLVGIGVKTSAQKPIILNVYPNSPADHAGIKKNDYILSINNQSTAFLSALNIHKLLKGKENTKVSLVIKRNNKVIPKTITRQNFDFNPVSSRLLANNIGYIMIDSFISENTPTLFENEVRKFSKSNGLIIDVRDNSGGLLKNAIQIADSLLSEGKIVTTVNKTEKVNEYANAHSIYKGNIVLLVNKNTASASEIFVAALKENNKATVIGEKTFGKGLVQEVIELPDKSGLHVTVAEYLTPSGRSINYIGIKPDKLILQENKLLATASRYLKNNKLIIAKNKSILDLSKS